MAKKSIYLFSTVILGVSLVPNAAWANETAESIENNVTTEIVESASMNQVQPVAEPISSQPIEQEGAAVAEESHQEETPVLVSEGQEMTSETTDLGVGETSLVSTSIDDVPVETEHQESVSTEEPTVESGESVEPTVSNPADYAEPETINEAVSTKAATPPLKNDNDGKIVDHDQAITDENTKIPTDYEFMPNFANVEDIVIGGTNNYTSDGYSYVFDLDSEKPNTITVTYKNVGTYKGKTIDMRITVKGWTALAGKQVLYINKDNGITMKGIRDVLLNYAFLDNLNANPVNVSGFFNFTDIDFEQSIDLFNNNNIQNFYVTKNNQLYYKVHNDYIKIGEINNQNTNHYDMRYWLTYTYKNVSNFDVRYNQDYETDAVFNYSFKLPFAMGGISDGVDPTIPIDVEMPDEEKQTESTQSNTTGAFSSSVIIENAEGTDWSVQASVPSTAPDQMTTVQTKEAELPKTNEQTSSILTIIGGACVFLFTALFLNKKKI